jgi:hypothetical protein
MLMRDVRKGDIRDLHISTIYSAAGAREMYWTDLVGMVCSLQAEQETHMSQLPQIQPPPLLKVVKKPHVYALVFRKCQSLRHLD